MLYFTIFLGFVGFYGEFKVFHEHNLVYYSVDHKSVCQAYKHIQYEKWAVQSLGWIFNMFHPSKLNPDLYKW